MPQPGARGRGRSMASVGFATYADDTPRDLDRDAAYRSNPMLRGKVVRMRVPARPEEDSPESGGVPWLRIGAVLVVVGGLALGVAVTRPGVLSPPPQPRGVPADSLRVAEATPAPLAPAPEDSAVAASAPPALQVPHAAPSPPRPASPEYAVIRNPQPSAAPSAAPSLRTVRVPAGPPRLSPPPAPKLVANVGEAATVAAVNPAQPLSSCGIAAGVAQQVVCNDPALAAADRRMSQVYAAALAAGITPEALRLNQEDWLDIRELAARRSRRALATVYQQRIDELQAMAREYRQAGGSAEAERR